MKGGIRLGQLRGVPIVADASAIVLGVLFAVLVFVVMARSAVGAGTGLVIVTASGVGLGVVACVLAHELSHALVASGRGHDVLEVRVNMFGGHTLMAGQSSPLDELIIAAAGPLASLALAGVFGIGSVIAGDAYVAMRALWALALVNAAIGLFNLLPGLPLDGGRMLQAGITSWRDDKMRATRIVGVVGQATGWVMIGAGVSIFVSRRPLGLLVGVVGWYLARLAAAAASREELVIAFSGMQANEIMRTTPDAVPADMTVHTMLELFVSGPELRALPVESGGRVVGVIGQAQIDSTSEPDRRVVLARDVMVPIGPDDVVAESEPVNALLQRPPGPAGVAVVVHDDVVVGIIDADALGSFLPGRSR